MAEVTRPNYRCTQGELYSITNLAINNLEEDLAAFAAKKAKYDASFITAMRALRTTAMNLPDEESRNAVHQTLKNQLPALAEICKDNFNDLKGYIRDGWPNDNPTPRYEAAGLNKYNKIGTNNWENVDDMNESMKQFIADNTAVLTSPGGMPGTFAGKVDGDTSAFGDTYALFLSSRETGTATAAKIKADNNLYEAVTDFQKDGVEMVFRRDAEKQKRYTFSALKDIVSPPGSSSLEVKAKKPDDSFATTGMVKIKKEGVAAIMAQITAEGAAAFPNVDAGKYDGEVTVDGVTKTFTKVVEVGTNARITVNLA